MTVQSLLQTYSFNEIFHLLCGMFPEASNYRSEFQQAYNLFTSLAPAHTKKVVTYQLMFDPDTEENFFGADDSDFNDEWVVIAGKKVVKEEDVDLTDAQMAANCLLNVIFIGRHPKAFNPAFESISNNM